MKKVWIVIISVLFVLLPAGVSAQANNKGIETNQTRISQRSKMKEIADLYDLEEDAYIVSVQLMRSDSADTVILYHMNENLAEGLSGGEIFVAVREGKTGKITKKALGFDSCYMPSCVVVPSDANSNLLLICAKATGTGDASYFALMDYNEGTLTQTNMFGIQAEGALQEGFKGSLRIPGYKQDITVDLRDQKDEYIDYGAYDKAGKVLKGNAYKLNLDGFETFAPIKAGDELNFLGVQRVWGYTHSNVVGQLISVYELDEQKKLVLKDAFIRYD